MGVEPFMISGSLLGVLAQRLVRRVCGQCRVAYNPSQGELARFGLSAANEREVTFYKANTLTIEEIQQARKQGNLCVKCGGSGYKGRIGVYEIMQNSERLQQLIYQGATTDRLKEAAVDEGMVTLLAYSLNLVQRGLHHPRRSGTGDIYRFWSGSGTKSQTEKRFNLSWLSHRTTTRMARLSLLYDTAI
ncbi:MAG UNVERIFIED_CONTAM: hypothetical protein LVR29_28540 [Microcystis novacekii LVE1205-3]|jgi:type IV pilus assembly protein PilB